MGILHKFRKLCHFPNLRVGYVLGFTIAVLIILDLSVFRYGDYASILSPVYMGKIFVIVSSGTSVNSSESISAHTVTGMVDNATSAHGFDKVVMFEREAEGKKGLHEILFEAKGDNDTHSVIEEDIELKNGLKSEKGLGINRAGELAYLLNSRVNFSQEKDGDSGLGSVVVVKELPKDSSKGIHEEASNGVEVKIGTSFGSLQLMRSGPSEGNSEYYVSHSLTPVSPHVSNMSVIHQDSNDQATKPQSLNPQSPEIKSGLPLNPPEIKTGAGFTNHHATQKNRRDILISISQMNLLLLKKSTFGNSVRLQLSSARDRELQKARLEIETAPIIRDVPDVQASVFRNYSMFIRSYQLMERLLKVYVYKEGERPIFHQPHMRGIYASEGWFMKLMEANRQFVVKDAKKAHLFYLPFSAKKLRSAIDDHSFTNHRDLENHLNKYVDMIAKKYRFWNRTAGTDHFLVACHDWGPGFTRKRMRNCIRALCNTNIAKDFKIGKDVSLPVTYVRSAENPLMDVVGNHPSKRPNLAFFAGAMHGYLRPILLNYWSNKEPDMKIFGPLPRDIEGKAKYREYMKTSRYCICARGYEVHTPRVVESIYSGCVPVIISDNYVPPFFEILNWEAFSVFILEKDVPNLRNILLSIPQEKYIAMHQKLRAVQHHFLWHKSPLKYDLFHMILHSVWYNRVFQMRPG